MRLNKSQKELVLKWMTAGLHSDEINELAAQQLPPFSIGRSQLTYFRKTRASRLEQIRQAGEDQAMVEGYASSDYRVRRLAMLAQLLEQDLLSGGRHADQTGDEEQEEGEGQEKDKKESPRPAGHRLWLRQKKGIGSKENYETVIYYEFNAAELQQYRGLLDDIAKETGGRAIKHEVEAEVDLIWDLPVPGFNPPASESESAK